MRTIPRHPSQVLVGIFWMLLAALLFSGLNTSIRLAAGDGVPVLEIVFFRNFFNLVFMLPWLFQIGLSALRTQRIGLHGLRSTFGLIAMLLQFWGIALMPLADGTALSFTAPLFATIGVALVAGETVRLRRWIAIGLGFAGVLIIIRPGVEIVSLPALMIVAASMFVGGSFTCVKLLSRTESPNVMVLYMGLFMAPASFVPALFVWVWPSPMGWLYLVGVGGCATLAHLCFNRAFAATDASVVLPFDYTRLLFAAAIGFVLYGEIPDFWMWVGAGVIVSANLYIAHREAVRAKGESLARAATADKLGS